MGAEVGPLFWFPEQGEIRAGDDAESQAASFPEHQLAKTTHLCVGAHPDDLEILGIHGILECYRQPGRAFFGVVTCDGAGSARIGPYAQVTDRELVRLRRREQMSAARLGEYAGLCLLGHSSAEVKRNTAPLQHELMGLLLRATPDVVYTHSPLDLHDTHVAVLRATLAALRTLPQEKRPKRLLGCEVWGSLDFLDSSARVELDVSQRPHLQAALLGVYDSQIAGGKRYDLATLGRRRAHATFGRSHQADGSTGLTFALDLTPLLDAVEMSLRDYVRQLLEDFSSRALARLATEPGP